MHIGLLIIKKDGILTFRAKWMELYVILLSGINQTEKELPHVLVNGRLKMIYLDLEQARKFVGEGTENGLQVQGTVAQKQKALGFHGTVRQPGSRDKEMEKQNAQSDQLILYVHRAILIVPCKDSLLPVYKKFQQKNFFKVYAKIDYSDGCFGS